MLRTCHEHSAYDVRLVSIVWYPKDTRDDRQISNEELSSRLRMQSMQLHKKPGKKNSGLQREISKGAKNFSSTQGLRSLNGKDRLPGYQRRSNNRLDRLNTF